MRRVIFILGRAGSGKGTISKHYIQDHTNVRWIESGNIIRSKLATNTEIQAIINSGNLIPTEMICKLVLEEINLDDRDVIVDGYPRTKQQLVMIKQMLHDVDVSAILIDCTADVAMNRLLHRVADRNDDYPEAIVQRFKIFDANIDEICEEFGDALIRINGNDNSEISYKRFCDALK